MRNIIDVLTDLEPKLLSEIKGYFLSINKIDTDSNQFISLCEKYPEISEAIYIVNPNMNNSNGSVFLGEKGKIVFSADFFENLIGKRELDFTIESPNLTKNHPLGDLLNKDFEF